MPTDDESLFEIRGFSFGASDTPFILRELTPAMPATLTSDVDNRVRGGVLPGRDVAGGSLWLIRLETTARTEAGARAALASLAAAWQPVERALDVLPLRYRLNGRWRRVYGRPRGVTPVGPSFLGDQGFMAVEIEFYQTDPLYYADSPGGVSLNTVPPATGGLLAPLASPLSTVRSGGFYARHLVSGGETPTPIALGLQGPLQSPSVRIGNWTLQVNGNIPYDRRLVVDARSKTVTWENGSSAAGLISPRTRLSDLTLPPGQSEVIFNSTGDGYLDVAWRDAHLSL